MIKVFSFLTIAPFETLCITPNPRTQHNSFLVRSIIYNFDILTMSVVCLLLTVIITIACSRNIRNNLYNGQGLSIIHRSSMRRYNCIIDR